jgi:hypothetical protein
MIPMQVRNKNMIYLENLILFFEAALESSTIDKKSLFLISKIWEVDYDVLRSCCSKSKLLVSNFTTIIRLLKSIMGINSSAIAAIIKILRILPINSQFI